MSFNCNEITICINSNFPTSLLTFFKISWNKGYPIFVLREVNKFKFSTNNRFFLCKLTCSDCVCQINTSKLANQSWLGKKNEFREFWSQWLCVYFFCIFENLEIKRNQDRINRPVYSNKDHPEKQKVVTGLFWF